VAGLTFRTVFFWGDGALLLHYLCRPCLYFMGLNLSNQQIALELGLNKDDVQAMTTQLREGIIQAEPEVQLEGVIETDEVYIVAGHKGNPEGVKKKAVHHEGDA
jgi:hypothetical protein